MEINSVEYWNKRFETDWNDFDGDTQTVFFANTLCNLLPEWFINEVRENSYSVCDLGCAEGDAIPIWNDIFRGSSICGEDFAESAIRNARNKYPEFMYLVSDIMQPEGKRKYDVIISSNTVEHFKNTEEVMSNICERSRKYTLLLIPYREDKSVTDEHEAVFHTNRIPYIVDDNVLVCAKTCRCDSIYYSGEQILLIYSKNPKGFMLSDLVEYVNSDSYERLEVACDVANKKIEKLENDNTIFLHQREDLEKEKAVLINQKKALEEEKEDLEKEKEDLEKEKVVLIGQKEALEEEKESLHVNVTALVEKIDKLKIEQEMLENELTCSKKKTVELEEDNTKLKYDIEKSELIRNALEGKINRAIAMCNELTNWGLYKFSHWLHRTKHQFFNRSSYERKSYIKWIIGYLKGNGTDSDRRFKPVYRIADILKEPDNNVEIDIPASRLGDYLRGEEKVLDDDNLDYEEVNQIKDIIQNDEYSGIVVYPHVVQEEAFQKAQQLLSFFAKSGWLCFCCEDPSKKSGLRIIEENIVVVHEKEFLHAIINQEIVILLTWLGSCTFMNKIKNKKVWYHLSNKLDSYMYYDETYLELHQNVIAAADCVSYSEETLKDYVSGRKDVVYLPDGVSEQSGHLENIKIIERIFNKELDIELGKTYNNYDVIILSVIDYNFRFQRPQQIAVRYAQNGHRVFYFNANFYNEHSVSNLQKNLYVINIHNDLYSAIYLTDWAAQEYELKSQIKEVIDSYCIRDAIVIVDYPNWIGLSESLREEYGFKIITDYMDDYTGFLNPAEDLVKINCERLLCTSDLIIASSQFLYDIAVKYNNNIELIRNGTEFSHFNSVFGETEHARKIIGYYGAVAEWFQVKKVAFLAKNLPECDIVIIGDITNKENDLRKYSNIKLLGEKPYNELPEYLKDFDVCIIPFDTSTDLIKATNPVKFYEYLSAGKKIVSTEIPELEPYRDKYVYMANEDEKFLEYIKICISGNDTLCSAAECAEFARMHDWQERYEMFYKAVRKAVPKVSIVVLTYNNLAINKLCINSILEKTAYPNYELIVVDNCSVDGTKEYLSELSEKAAHIKVIINEENIGFAAGNNVGIREADGDYIVLLNNDTVVTRGWLTALSKHMENDKSIGMCGPVTNSIGNEAEIIVDYHSMGELERFSYDYTSKHLTEEYRDINVLALFCTMISREVVNACGYLDETYGIGMFEDDDYAEAVKAKGYTLIVAEDAFIHHFGSVSFKKLEDEEYSKIFNTNKERFEKKWGSQWKTHKYRKGVTAVSNIDSIII